MKNPTKLQRVFYLLGLSLLAIPSIAQQDYEELSITQTGQEAAWKSIPADIHYSWGSTNVRYDKTAVPVIQKRNSHTLTGWKGEKLNALLVVWNNKQDCTVSMEIGEFINKKGDVLPKSCFEQGFIRYVMTDEYNIEGKHSCEFRPDKAAYDSSLVADVIDVREKMQLKKQHLTPMWLTARLPQDVAIGTYTGKVILLVDGEEFGQLQLKINIMNRVLPKPADWHFHLDLWQNPYAVARYHGVEVWSQEHFDRMRPLIKALAEAGQKVITASIMHKPWNGQTYDYFQSMIVWRKTLAGEWKFTYDVFDKWVEFMMSLGIDQQINCYSMVPWSFSFQYFDERTNSLQAVNCKPGEPTYNEMWTAFLTDFAKHLKEKNWFDKTCIAMDERPMPVMKTVISLVKGIDKDFKIALAGLYYADIERDLYDYCISTDQLFPQEVLERRAEENRVTTYYTYCADCKPNSFTFSDPAESAWMALYTAKLGLDGYLRWAYNSWVANPLQDSRFRQWPAGDTYLVYPGFRSSVRFEKLIEGIQLVEKIRLLKKEYKNNKRVLKRMENALESLEIKALNVQNKAADDVDKINKLVNIL